MNQEPVRDHLVAVIEGSHSHDTFEKAVANWKPELRGVRPNGAKHSAWQILEHMRIAQWDILEFSRSARHVSPEWPEGYWPTTAEPPDAEDWDESIEWFTEDRNLMVNLITDPKLDLFRRIPHGTGQTLLQEALTLATHNSYHIGQLMMLRRMLGA
jgi:hypothetical protein